MRISVRSLNGEAADLELEPSTTMADLKAAIASKMHVPAEDQRLIYAGFQLEDTVCEAWRKRRGNSAYIQALGANQLPDGAPLTLEHHNIQKGSVINMVQRAARKPDSQPGSEGTCAHTGGGAAAAAAEPQGAVLPMEEPILGPMVAAHDDPVEVLGPRLDALSDQDALRVLQPFLQSRPFVRAQIVAWSHGQGSGGHAISGQSPTPTPPIPAAAPHCPYRVNDPVGVWSNTAKKWFAGEVVAIADGSTDQIPAGSLEVAFPLGRKWILPEDAHKYLAPADYHCPA
mmetsp:Transcript_88201/g.175180  ORF Transcript_88201/g.175180 Transcript_88201/m.175180 type:complete len:286 (-) Transcript_88201:299-1156(-)